MLGLKSDIPVPETFPSILKSYVKDAIRTQPYDLLSWSAAYFRCIANDINPPVKLRYEENSDHMIESKCLTREYLKVLVKQIGKGYFVDRKILQLRWKSLGLSEIDFLMLLKIGGMLYWERIHWLELVSVMAASLCENFESSINFICELLTDNTEDDSIPIWMFIICYTFLAQLDYRTEIPSTATPSLIHSPIEPTQINAGHFRKALLDDWKSFVDFNGDKMNPSLSLTFNRIKEVQHFTEIIDILSENKSEKEETDENNDKEKIPDSKWKYEIIRQIGAPWSWIYQFVNHFSRHSQSYNFYECQHDYTTESFHNVEAIHVDSMKCAGIGSAIPVEITSAFLAFIKAKANENDGMIKLKVFENEMCPRMC